MEALDKFVIKTALETLRAAGGTGLKKAALLNQMDLAAGVFTSEEQREAAFSLMKGRGWINSHFESVWHEERWTITERGMTALEGM